MNNLDGCRMLGFGVRLVRKIYTAAFESRYNIRTGFDKVQFLNAQCNGSQPYEPTDYLLIREFIAPLKPQPSDVVFDIGCGMGRVLCAFARMNITKCIGIEMSPELAVIATRNAERVHARKANIEVRIADATCEDYSEGTIFWLFNPFGKAAINAMLDRIEESLKTCPRKIRIAYINPVHEDAFQSRPWLTGFERKSPWYSRKEAVYWESL